MLMKSSIALLVFVSFFGSTLVIGNWINQAIVNSSIQTEPGSYNVPETFVNDGQVDPEIKDFQIKSKWSVINDSEEPLKANRKLGSKRTLVVTDIGLLKPKTSRYQEESKMTRSNDVTLKQSNSSLSHGLNFEDSSEMTLSSYDNNRTYITQFDTNSNQYPLIPFTCNKVELTLINTWTNEVITSHNYSLDNVTITRCPVPKN
jgi:hypothetical protein